MKFNVSTLFFLMFMIFGTVLCLSSNNWLFIWCSLELSLICFLPIMHNKLIIASESLMKYFLIQSVSSAMLIIGIMSMLMMTMDYKFIISTAVMIKVGVAPFHMWVLSIIEGMKILPMMLLLTLSKIAPLMILSMMPLGFAMISFATMLTGSIMGLNQSSIRKIICYSSIFNMGLILMSIKCNSIWTFYLLVYSLMLIMLMTMIKKLNVNYMNQLIINEKSIKDKMNLWLILLSMGGMPPLMGFTIKLTIIEFMNKEFMIINLIMMIMLSLMVMFFYMRMSYLSLMMFSINFKWMIFSIENNSSLFMIFNTMLLPIILMMSMFN
uniref:NADH dehydrogenase subunit 2 n=1 Tax=Singapora shinshana TaxID=1539856 RepID=UPI002238D336|nr:NADH dehydrogenase subunit 2 [Singapora shinshana]UYF20488.1 NADH dehydrogenase subunit 2 [Singapora shinshana]